MQHFNPGHPSPPVFCHSHDRFAFLLLTQTLHVSMIAKDPSKSSLCHIGYPEASSYRALLKVMLVWHTMESRSLYLYVSVRTRTVFLHPCVRFQPCLILFAFKLSFMLFGACFAPSLKITRFHICVSLMFSCSLFASNGILIKAHVFFMCIKVCCCSLIEDEQQHVQVTIDSSALNNISCKTSNQWFCAEYLKDI